MNPSIPIVLSGIGALITMVGYLAAFHILMGYTIVQISLVGSLIMMGAGCVIMFAGLNIPITHLVREGERP